MFHKKLFFLGFLFLSGCGFSPLYSLDQDEKTTALTQEISIASIANYDGYVLKKNLENALNPNKVGGAKRYVLQVTLDEPLLTDQSIQGDNFASREKMSVTASYVLKDKENNKVLLSSSTTALGAYNIVKEPYATYKAQTKQKEDLIKIVGNNISLRVIAYFKKQEVNRESQTISN